MRSAFGTTYQRCSERGGALRACPSKASVTGQRPSSRRAACCGASVAWLQHHRRPACEAAPQCTDSSVNGHGLRWIQPLLGASAAAILLLSATPAVVQASDAAKVGVCLLQKCQIALAECVADGGCLEDLICLNSCNGKPDETGCQIKCGDQYEDKAVQLFNECAVSSRQCVPKRVDSDLYPVPAECAEDKNFQLDPFQGPWYISAGLNPLFDTFDCQVHFFAVPEPGKLVGKLNWRVAKPNGDFLERSAVQNFVQQSNPAVLLNHGNKYLHYEDDWYILASKPGEYVFVYYIGNNDAWKGYGGAVVYTKARELPKEYIPELREAAKKVSLNWDDFVLTNNTCPPHPPRLTLGQEVQELEAGLQNDLQSFGKGFTVLEKELATDVQKEEAILAADLQGAEDVIGSMERDFYASLQNEEKSIQQQISNFVGSLGNGVQNMFKKRGA